MKWCAWMTTVPERVHTTFPLTLQSIKDGGFCNDNDNFTIFVDGLNPGDTTTYKDCYKDNIKVVQRWPRIKTFGNWMLSLLEMYIRYPHCDRYLALQDDFVTYRNLRSYLESSYYPEMGYCNLYTFPCNQEICPTIPNRNRPSDPSLSREFMGWYPSDQRGKGAVALMFSNHALKVLLSCRTDNIHHLVGKAADPTDKYRFKNVDGGVISAMGLQGWKEYVHNPSLVQHIVSPSMSGNEIYNHETSFRGENFDASDLVNKCRTLGQRESISLRRGIILL